MRKALCMLLIATIMLMAMPIVDTPRVIDLIDKEPEQEYQTLMAHGTRSGEITVDDNATFVGTVDYDSQVACNSKGNYVAFWGRNPDNRLCAKYSLDGGTTWLPTDSRVILFSNDTSLDGIIDDDQGAMWEYSSDVYNDVLYISFHLGPYASSKVGFTKCDISNVSNITSFSNWKSANSSPPPSLGNGSDGHGYDVLSGTSVIDPSITVRHDKDILITCSLGGDLQALRWNGSSWSSVTEIRDLATDITVSSLRRTQEKDWVCAFTSDGDGYAMRCDALDNPLNSTHWKTFNGTVGEDKIMENSTVGFHWQQCLVDSNNYVHSVCITNDLIAGMIRIWHNYHNGTVWVNGTNEGAGGRVGGTDPKVKQGSARYMGANADSGGQIIVLYNGWNQGVMSIFWNETDGWDVAGITEEIDGGTPDRKIVEEGYMRGIETDAPFLLADPNVKITFCKVNGSISGDPWWENYTAEHLLCNITLYKDYWNFKGYPNSTELNVTSLYSLIPNCICICGKNMTTEYWYTYYPSVGLLEYWNVSFGDGLFILVDINTTWQVYNYSLTTSVFKSKYNPMVYSKPTDTNAVTIYSGISNTTSVIGKNATSGYWYTYWPGVGLLENWDIIFGDGLFILTDENSSWNHT